MKGNSSGIKLPGLASKRARLAVVLTLLLSSLLLAAPASAQQRDTARPVPVPPTLQLVEPLRLSTTTPKVGETVIATFKVKNTGSQPVVLQDLAAVVRPAPVPLATVRPTPMPVPVLDFPHVRRVTLQPGDVYAYSKSRSFPIAGAFFAEAMAMVSGRSGSIPGGTRVGFTVDSPPPAGLQVVVAIELSSASPRAGEAVTATFKVKNTGSQPLALQELAAAVQPAPEPPRPLSAAIAPPPMPRPVLMLDFPHVRNLTLNPGDEYQYRQSRAFPLPGSFVAEPVVRMGGRMSAIEGGNRVAFTVTRVVPGRLQVVEALRLSSANPAAGTPVKATFKVKNVGGQPLSVQELAATVRRIGTITDRPTADGLDFPHVRDITLQPGDVYSYEQSTSFATADNYVAIPAAKVNGWWSPIRGGAPARFTVGASAPPPPPATTMRAAPVSTPGVRR